MRELYERAPPPVRRPAHDQQAPTSFGPTGRLVLYMGRYIVDSDIDVPNAALPTGNDTSMAVQDSDDEARAEVLLANLQCWLGRAGVDLRVEQVIAQLRREKGFVEKRLDLLERVAPRGLRNIPPDDLPKLL